MKSIKWRNKEKILCKINLEIGDRIKIITRSGEVIFAILGDMHESMYHYSHKNKLLGLITNEFFEHKNDFRYIHTSVIVDMEKLPALSLDNLCVEWCPYCGQEVTIYNTGASVCPNCGTILLPCSQCEECIDSCPYDNLVKMDIQGNPLPTNPPVMPHEVALLETKSCHKGLEKEIYNPAFCRELAKIFTYSDSYEDGYKIATALLFRNLDDVIYVVTGNTLDTIISKCRKGGKENE